MPFYQKRGEVPDKRHTEFRRPDGELYTEQLMGREGFSGMASLLYHHRMPTAVADIQPAGYEKIETWDEGVQRHHHLDTRDFSLPDHPVKGRQWLLFNNDVKIGISGASESMDEREFYRNGAADEVWFVHDGSGTVHTIMGDLPYRAGDYIVLPQHITWRLEVDEPSRFMVVESQTQVKPPARYRNEFGQFQEHAPYSERDFHPPEEIVEHIGEKGEHHVLVKTGEKLSDHIFQYHPFDLVGWDGHYFPYTFDIRDFEPITGRIHMPPPSHLHFKGDGYVFCSFCPRMFDWDEKAIPAPYNHANVDSDEVLYYWDGEFMSRPHVGEYSFTLHPRGLPHGPAPGAAEASMDEEWTDEYAPMIDTFRPLNLADHAREFDNPDYATHHWDMLNEED